MSFIDYCNEVGVDPGQHLVMSQSEHDLVPQPNSDPVQRAASTIHGHGAFATEYIEQGDEIGLLVDLLLRRTDILGRWINHSDTPNARLRPIYSRGVVLIARNPILAGDEVTMDYRHAIPLRGGGYPGARKP